MVRTIISLDTESKEWLDRRAREENISTAELVRVALRKYREAKKHEQGSLDDLLQQTSGIWKAGDGLAFQRRERKEWRK